MSDNPNPPEHRHNKPDEKLTAHFEHTMFRLQQIQSALNMLSATAESNVPELDDPEEFLMKIYGETTPNIDHLKVAKTYLILNALDFLQNQRGHLYDLSGAFVHVIERAEEVNAMSVEEIIDELISDYTRTGSNDPYMLILLEALKPGATTELHEQPKE